MKDPICGMPVDEEKAVIVWTRRTCYLGDRSRYPANQSQVGNQPGSAFDFVTVGTLSGISLKRPMGRRDEGSLVVGVDMDVMNEL
jgi:hypothetical protein